MCVRVRLVHRLGYELGSECPCVWAGMYVGVHVLAVCGGCTVSPACCLGVRVLRLARGRAKAECGRGRWHALPFPWCLQTPSVSQREFFVAKIFLFSIYVALWICKVLCNQFY